MWTPLFLYITTRYSSSSTYNNDVVFIMISTSFPTPLSTTATFSGKSISPQSCHVRSRQVLISATATATRPSYLQLHQSMASCTSTHYEILGVAAVASNREIKAAYRRLARVSHPDVAAVDRKDSSADKFMKIHAAYSTLSDPEKRASYDRSLFRQRQPLMATRFSGYHNRNWETDQCW
ncbi:chaperone protein dnaJ 11, chloroplastic-like [Cicer arietinum]|uniref:Chaperone protein dnaJ 11, chloroplastic-like n=1 Tax=Cicer arietinum TaxID=3827 RepID=A0A1S2YSV1_CICAR|nr:chaperone protein dnaJ 11, chloroplastic-like [Cicer arietinum]